MSRTLKLFSNLKCHLGFKSWQCFYRRYTAMTNDGNKTREISRENVMSLTPFALTIWLWCPVTWTVFPASNVKKLWKSGRIVYDFSPDGRKLCRVDKQEYMSLAVGRHGSDFRLSDSTASKDTNWSVYFLANLERGKSLGSQMSVAGDFITIEEVLSMVKSL